MIPKRPVLNMHYHSTSRMVQVHSDKQIHVDMHGYNILLLYKVGKCRRAERSLDSGMLIGENNEPAKMFAFTIDMSINIW